MDPMNQHTCPKCEFCTISTSHTLTCNNCGTPMRNDGPADFPLDMEIPVSRFAEGQDLGGEG
jgi:hypothetical protein